MAYIRTKYKPVFRHSHRRGAVHTKTRSRRRVERKNTRRLRFLFGVWHGLVVSHQWVHVVNTGMYAWVKRVQGIRLADSPSWISGLSSIAHVRVMPWIVPRALGDKKCGTLCGRRDSNSQYLLGRQVWWPFHYSRSKRNRIVIVYGKALHTRDGFYYDRSKLFGTEGSQPQPIPQRSRRDSNPRTVWNG